MSKFVKLLTIAVVIAGCRADSVRMPDATNVIRSDPHGMFRICVTNMPVPELIAEMERECRKSKNGYSLQIRLVDNWKGQMAVYSDDDPFAPNSSWKLVDKMPRATIASDRIFITNLLHSIQSEVPYMGISYLNDGHHILITARPIPE